MTISMVHRRTCPVALRITWCRSAVWAPGRWRFPLNARPEAGPRRMQVRLIRIAFGIPRTAASNPRVPDADVRLRLPTRRSGPCGEVRWNRRPVPAPGLKRQERPTADAHNALPSPLDGAAAWSPVRTCDREPSPLPKYRQSDACARPACATHRESGDRAASARIEWRVHDGPGSVFPRAGVRTWERGLLRR